MKTSTIIKKYTSLVLLVLSSISSVSAAPLSYGHLELHNKKKIQHRDKTLLALVSLL